MVNAEKKNSFLDFQNHADDFVSLSCILGSDVAIIKTLLLDMNRRVLGKVVSMESGVSQLF